jgi:hypothetical protein
VVAESPFRGVRSEKERNRARHGEKEGKRNCPTLLPTWFQCYNRTGGGRTKVERTTRILLVSLFQHEIRSNCVPLWFRNLRTRNWVFSRSRNCIEISRNRQETFFFAQQYRDFRFSVRTGVRIIH